MKEKPLPEGESFGEHETMGSDFSPDKPDSMGDLTGRIAGLSDAKQALLGLSFGRTYPRADAEQSISRVASRDSAPLSFAQQRLWFLDHLEPNSARYNEASAFRLTGPLNIGALQKALDVILARHEVLRTTFAAVDGVPAQVIAESRPAELKVTDLSQVSAPKCDGEIQRLLREDASRPFNLSSDLMLRATLLKLEQEEHILLLVMHHIACDGWSVVGVLSRELAALYKAFCAGRPSPLAELPIQYADFAIWQRQWLQGKVLERHLSYWKQQLKEAPPLLELSTDRPRPPVESYRGARHSLLLPKTLVETLKALNRREGVTLFMTLLAAFKVLLHRYTGQVDIVVGSPVAGRTRVETEGLIGFFVNNVVFRSNLSGNPSFHELLGRVREKALAAYVHQDLPFEKLVEELQPTRDLGHHPLFQVMFVLENVPRQPLELPGLSVSSVKVDTGTAKFDLTLLITEAAGSLTASLEYNTDLFDKATIHRMMGHFQTLLESIVANPEQRLSDLPLLTEAERHQLLVEWNGTQAEFPKDLCIHELFEAQVERFPDTIAVVFDDNQLTYRELNGRANQLAHHLKSLGVGPEVLVGICMERSLEMIIGLMAILKAGGAYVPLDTEYPKERLAFMLEDAQVPVLLTQQRLMTDLPIQNPKSEIQNPVLVCLDTDWRMIARESELNPVSEVTAENLAYVIYTSGSTGKPKGVEIQHGALVNFLHSMRQRPGITGDDTLLSVTTVSFDIAALEIFLPLVVGARVVLVSREVAADDRGLMEQLEQSGATLMQATPATWRMLVDAGWSGSETLKILCGGEVLPQDLAKALAERGSSVWNLYGPTETTVWSTVWRVDPSYHRVPIGQPIHNTQVYILDSNLEPVPVGVAGQLYIGGAGVARGYLKRPELTAEKFVRNPYTRDPEARLFKSGDLARYLPNGEIEFLGRIDHQVKIRGFRIELAEIEAVLNQHPGVRETVVMAREDVPGDKRLVAYVVSNQDSIPMASDLRSFLRAKLPEHMVPSAFVVLDALPLAPNGKVNRRALPAPDQSRLEQEAPFVPPRTPVEELIARIWGQVLRVERISIHDNFFDLGGHSLMATQVISRLRDAFLVELPLRAIFESPTLAGLAESVETIQWTGRGVKAHTSSTASTREEGAI